MKITLIGCFVLLILNQSCSVNKHHQKEEDQTRFDKFNGQSMIWSDLDYTTTPINKTITHHQDDYKYLDSVDIFWMSHLSDSLVLNGFMVSPKDEGKYPCILFNRGGNRDYGQLLVATAVNIMSSIAAEGYVVVATNYRGNSGGDGKEEFGGSDVRDVLNLMDALSDFPKSDTTRIGLLGVSRGGMMNYLAMKGNRNQNIKAVISIGGITDLETTIKYHPEINKVAEDLIPGFKTDRKSKLESRSAIYWAQELPKKTPFLILHGMADQHVDYSQVEPFADSLDKYNVSYQLHSFENENHGISNQKERVSTLIKNWFQSYLKEGESFNLKEKRIIE